MHNAINPLIAISDLVAFDSIRPDHVTPAFDTLLEEAQATVARLEADTTPATWNDFIEPLDTATERLSRAWNAVSHINAVADTPELRAAYSENLPRVTEFWTGLAQNQKLFERYKAIALSPEFAGFSAARKRVIDNALRDFRLGGAELAESERQRFAQIQESQAALGQQYSEHVLDATNDFALFITDVAELAGMPADAILAAQERAQADGRDGYKITLHMPSYLAVMQSADSRPLREKLYTAYSQRASEFGRADLDNSAIIVETLKLKAEEAALLGYASFADLSLVPKMARTPSEVETFLNDLAQRARPYAQNDVGEMRAFATEHLAIPDLQAWDTAYVAEKLREARYAFSEQEVKNYFPEPQVLAGLFRVIETLFAVRIKPDVAPVWHPDARFFRVESIDGALVAQFYLDLYARPGKRGGAWMDNARTRRRIAGKLQTPIAFLTCNFSAPVGGKPARFSHDEVITLFHEFGHGLHHMLTQIDEMPVSGISGVEWDAVELPSQFMENFCWEWDVVQHMTHHAETGETLPRALFDKMIAAKNFQAGLQTLRQIEFGLFDMRLHAATPPSDAAAVQRTMDAVRREISVLIPPAWNRFQNQFAHIFAGGYAAGYYSYKWAEVLSADAYAQFEQDGVLNTQTGQRFRDEILGVGGSRPAMESFVSFRGREPRIDALLRHNGMSEAPQASAPH